MRWYDNDPILKEALELLKLQPEETKNEAANFMLKLQEDVAGEVIERVYDIMNTYQGKGNRWYDNDPVMMKGIELLRNAPPKTQRIAALKLLIALEQNSFDEVCRFELNLNSIVQIKSSLEITDTRLRTVLHATTNPIQAFLDDVLSNEQPLPMTTAKSYFVGLVLRDCNFDIAQVENKMRQLYPSKGTNISKVMKPYRTMLSQIQQSCNNRKADLLHLLA